MKTTTRWLLALLAGFSLIIAACGDDDDDTSGTEPTEETAADDGAVDDTGGDEDLPDLSSYGTERPEGELAGTVYDVMTFQTIAPEVAVCTTETMLAGTTEEELLDAGYATIEDTVVVVAIDDCGLDPEAEEGLRTSLARSALNAEGAETG